MAQAQQRPTPKDKRRRRRRTIASVLGYVVVAIGLAWFFELQATTTIMFVRHAETDEAMGNNDVGLNTAGLARAEQLADFVRDIDVVASVDAIYASEFRRTQQTAMPLAKRLGIEMEIADHHDVKGFMGRVLKEHKGKIVLVVSHADTIAPLIEELHGSKNIGEIPHDVYDDFFIVTIPWYGKVKTLQLHYGLPSPATPVKYGR